MRRFACLFLLTLLPTMSVAEAASLARQSLLLQNRNALLGPRDAPETQAQSASLFSGPATGSLFAPVRRRAPAQITRPLLGSGHSQLARLRQIIEFAESRREGYDAVQHGARIKPPKRPTQMTIREIYRWIDDTPRQPHAIGRYQFIPKTLRRLVSMLDVPLDSRFSPQVQDHLADQLLREAGLNRMLAGEMTRHGFMNNLAKIWAGFPTSNGRSYYHGFAGNKASITWARFDAYMVDIFGG